jgi:hypothetical protein
VVSGQRVRGVGGRQNHAQMVENWGSTATATKNRNRRQKDRRKESMEKK